MTPSVHRFSIAQVVADREIGERIYMQVCHLQPDAYLGPDKSKEFWPIVIDLMKKLEKVKYHVQGCREQVGQAVENAMREQTIAPTASVAENLRVVNVNFTSGVEAEVEAFLIQCKASLDVLCKILRPTTGIFLATFGDKGRRVAQALERNIPKERQPQAAELVRLLREDEGWLTRMINLRDSVTHHRGLTSTGVRSERRGQEIVVNEPADEDGVPFTKILETLYFNLLTFCEDFVALALGVAMPPGLVVAIVGATERANLAEYKYALAMVNPAGSK